MKAFDKKDIPALDFIINELCKTPLFNSSDLKKGGFLNISKDGYDSITQESDEEIEFERLLSIIKQFNCAKCVVPSKLESPAYIEQTPETPQFKKQGGFKKLYSDLNKNNLNWYKIIPILVAIIFGGLNVYQKYDYNNLKNNYDSLKVERDSLKLKLTYMNNNSSVNKEKPLLDTLQTKKKIDLKNE